MRSEKDDRFRIGSGTFGNHIAGFIDTNFQSSGFQEFLDEFGALAFAEFRSGNFGEMDLLLGDPIGIFADPVESASAIRRNGKLFDRVIGSARGQCDHQKKDTGDVREFHVFRARILAARQQCSKAPLTRQQKLELKTRGELDHPRAAATKTWITLRDVGRGSRRAA